jgi:hypothetical protein
MLRRTLKAALVIAALACLIHDANALGHARGRGVVRHYLGGYGTGPFGYGDFVYAGYPTYNWQANTWHRHR